MNCKEDKLDWSEMCCKTADWLSEVFLTWQNTLNKQ